MACRWIFLRGAIGGIPSTHCDGESSTLAFTRNVKRKSIANRSAIGKVTTLVRDGADLRDV